MEETIFIESALVITNNNLDIENNGDENEEKLKNIKDVSSVIMPLLDSGVAIVQEDTQQNTVEDGIIVVPQRNRREIIRRSGIICHKITYLVSVILGLADVFTDLWLLYQYVLDQQYWYCGLTALFIWLPSLMTTCTLYKICEHEDKNSWLYKWFVKWKWPLLFTFTFQMSSSVFALKHVFTFKIMCKQGYEDKERRLLQLQLIDAFTEAAPQATLQSYIWSSEKQLRRWQLISLLFSYGTIARVASSRTFNMGTSNANRNRFVHSGVYTYIINIWLIMSRIPLASVAFHVSPLITLYCVLAHCSLCYIGLGYLKWKLPDRQLLTHFFTFPGVSIYLVFIDIDTSTFGYRIFSKLRFFMLYYALFVLEHIALTIVCLYYWHINVELIMCSIVCGALGLFFSLVTCVVYKTRDVLQVPDT